MLAVRLLLMGLATLPCRAAWANDTSAELATGGLVLTKNADIEMRSEELYVSSREVRVSYRFYNTSPAVVRTLVAFPMPDITVEDPVTMISVPTDNPQNLLGFSTVVNGAPVRSRVEPKALAGGIDRTADLHRLKVPLAPHLRATDQALDRLPSSAQDELAKLGLVEDYGNGDLSPRWTLKTTYYWEQTFPARREITIEHRYKPSVGLTSVTPLGDAAVTKEGWFKEYQQKYCVDQAFLAAFERASRAAKTQERVRFMEERISYLLSTGANWSRPIGDFRLIVDKGDPANLVSFCAEGVRKISATRFEVRKTDYLPNTDLHVLILKRIKQ